MQNWYEFILQTKKEYRIKISDSLLSHLYQNEFYQESHLLLFK